MFFDKTNYVSLIGPSGRTQKVELDMGGRIRSRRAESGFYGVRVASESRQSASYGMGVQLWHHEYKKPVEYYGQTSDCTIDVLSGIATAITLRGWRTKYPPKELQQKNFTVNVGKGFNPRNIWEIKNGIISRAIISPNATSLPQKYSRGMAHLNLEKLVSGVVNSGGYVAV